MKSILLPALLLSSALTLPALAARPMVDELTELYTPAQLDSPKLSPDGTRAAFRVRQGDVYVVGIHNFATGRMTLSKGDEKIVPTGLWWTGPNRLLVLTTSDKADAIGYTALDRDGGHSEDMWRLAKLAGVICEPLPDDPSHVLMFRHGNIVKVNIDTGHEETVRQQINWVDEWVIDRHGQPRAAIESDGHFGERNVWFCPPGSDAWRSRTFTGNDRQFYPGFVDRDIRYVVGFEYGPDCELTISRLDTLTGAVAAVQPDARYDPTSVMAFGRTREAFAITYKQGRTEKIVPLNASDIPGVERMEKHFAGYEVVVRDAMPDGKNWLLWVGNSRHPGNYVLFNHETGDSYLLGLTRGKNLSPDRLAPGEYFTFPSRHGDRLSARLWRPKDTEHPPLIVICPDTLPTNVVQDVYDADVQAFVRQGYAVIEVNAHNSWGFGKAGRQLPTDRWIDSLREDLEDAVQALAGQNVIDRNHVDLYGENFAGVLALHVAARSKLFAAVATINVPQELHRDDLHNLSSETGSNPLADKFGGWRQSEKFARDLSPVLIVPTLNIPALYLHSEEGSIRGRPTEDGRAIREAAKKARAPAVTGLAYTWSQYPKKPSVFAREYAEVSLKIGTFFRHPAPAAGP